MKGNRAMQLVGYFNAQVLAAYRSEPDKYAIETDDFHGTISVTDWYFRQLQAQDKMDEAINVRFGYRTLDSGEVAIAAFMPDLTERSKAHLRRWSAFHLTNPIWRNNDKRFEKWTRRYLDGSWGVKSGPLAELRKAVNTVNAIVSEAVGLPLFADGMSEALPFPSAENTHRYEDAHADLYRYLIDGIDKGCIERLGQRLGRPTNAKSDRTIQALKKALPQLADNPAFNATFDLVSTQRRKADHNVRPAAQAFPAFEKFSEDLWICHAAVKELEAVLEQELGVKGPNMTQRHEAKTYLPVIAAPAEPNFSVCQAERMKGKTIERVEYGFRKVHSRLAPERGPHYSLHGRVDPRGGYRFECRQSLL